MFDPRSLFLAGALTSLLCAVMLYTSRRVHPASTPGVLVAASASVSMGVAMLLIALRTLVPDWASVEVANGFGMVGGLLVFDTARRITGAPPRPHAIWTAIAVIASVQTGLGSGPEQHLHRIVLTSMVQGGFVAAIIPLLWRRRRVEPPVPLAWIIGCAAACALGHAARVVHTLSTGVTVGRDGMVAGNLTIALMVLFFALAPMIFAMALIGLVNGRIGLELRRMATTDPLSGLPNRKTVLARAQGLLSMSNEARPITAVMMLDLDRFKAINDRYGHAAGDDVIADFGRLLRTTVPRDALAGRYGGEEFCVVARVASELEALELAERVRRAAARRRSDRPAATVLDGVDGDTPTRPSIRFTVSIGVALAPRDATGLEALLLIADRRVYLAKADGRNRVVAQEVDATRAADDLGARQLIEV
ncbi:MAG: diguanylate cyclase [Lautropia sp.]